MNSWTDEGLRDTVVILALHSICMEDHLKYLFQSLFKQTILKYDKHLKTISISTKNKHK